MILYCIFFMILTVCVATPLYSAESNSVHNESSSKATKTTATPNSAELTTKFDLLRFWSGESLMRRSEFFHDHADDIDKSGRKYKNSRKTLKKSTRFSFVDNNERRNNTAPYATEDNLKLHGYTLKENMQELMSVLDANVTISVIGTTIEFHEIVLCQISKRSDSFFRAMDADKYVVEEKQKKIILIVHGLVPMGFRHIPCLYKSESFMKLVHIYTSYVDKFDIFLIPMANPDGIMDETLQLWNKNKSPQSSCPGVAVDRNFDVEWNNTGKTDSCCQQYPGPRPFSEPESRAVADLIHHYNHKIVAYIHVHGGTYEPTVFKGDAVLYPKGYDNVPENEKYIDIEAEIEESMRNAGFKTLGVAVTSLYDWYGKILGNSVDYATMVYGIPYGMEFVMQPYGLVEASDSSDEYHEIALTEVWRRIINVIFTHIYTNTEKVADSNE